MKEKERNRGNLIFKTFLGESGDLDASLQTVLSLVVLPRGILKEKR